VLIYVVLTILGFYMAFMPNVISTVSHFAFALDNSVDSSGAQLLGMLTYTFLGSYIWTLQYLIRRISNFDLAPISFFQSIGHMLLALFTMAAIWQSHIFAETSRLLIALAFFVGFFSDLIC